MSELRDRVTYSAYTDLLIDRDQIAPFGVQSTWHQTPEHSEPEEEVIKPKQKAVEPKIREIRSLSARKREREREEGNNKEIKNFRPLSAQKAPKRNVRMFKSAAGNSSTTATENDPFRIADDYGKCNFCNEINGDFSREQFLKLHMSENCPCLSKCDYCDQIVEVQKLNEHHLNRCKFVNGDLVPCSLCGLACYTGEKSHPRCRKMKPPENSEWCPLCSIAVRPHNSKEAWDKHLKNDCYNNPRKGGVPDPGWDYSLPDNIGEAPQKSKEPVSNPPSNSSPYPNQPPLQPPPQSNGQNPSNNNPSGNPPQYVYAQNPVNAETIKDAFQKIKDDREAELKVMRKKQAEREKKEEEAAELEAKRLEQEVDKLKKKKKEEETTKKKK
uniref:Centrosomal protein CEP104 Zn finger domain-containing protein n=1 Tax=Panagrolaimus superbus TaxID=310955 RepID=A0A914Y0J3_9BILA